MIWDETTSKCVREDDIFKLAQMESGTSKLVTQDGIDIAIIKYSNGAVQYSTDEKHFYTSVEEAIEKKKNPGFFTTAKGWFSSFIGGKTKDVDQESKDKRLAEEIAEAVQEDLTKKSKNYDREKVQLTGGLSSGLVASQFIGPLSMGITLPASSVALIASQGVPNAFRKDVAYYIAQRESGSDASIEKIKEGPHLWDPEILGLFDDNEDKLFATMETSYQRYCAAKLLRNEQCKG